MNVADRLPKSRHRHRRRAASKSAAGAGQIEGLADGVYELSYRSSDGTGEHEGMALAALRAGTILGCDQGGCMFTGFYDPASAVQDVQLTVDVPPNGEIVTGFTAGPDGARMVVTACMTDKTGDRPIAVNVCGAMVDVRLRYIGQISPL